MAMTSLPQGIGYGKISWLGATLEIENFLLKYGELGQLVTQLILDVEKMTQFVDDIVDPNFKTVQQLLENYLLEIDKGDRTMK
eukprot:9823870-Ditylum_brightwellii.AAC.1